MNIALDDIRKQAPKGATHYLYPVMILDLVYIKYIDDYPYYFKDGWWLRCNSYFECEELYPDSYFDANSPN